MIPPKTKKTRRPVSELISSLLGWIFIVAVAAVVGYMIWNAEPEGQLVCNTAGNAPSLTQFGSCHRE